MAQDECCQVHNRTINTQKYKSSGTLLSYLNYQSND